MRDQPKTLKTGLIFILSTIVVSAINGISISKEVREIISPDGKYRAYILSLPKASEGSQENKIEIRSASGKVLYDKSYGSEDGEHGFGVVHAAWTSDSKFFVYSMTSSGGHQSWHFPTDFIAVHDLQDYSLDEFLGPIIDPDFILLEPDIVKIVGIRYPNLVETKFEARLSQLLKGKKN